MIANVPLVGGNDAEPLPKRAVARVLVSEVHASSVRAVNYARTLELADTKAVFFAFDSDEARTSRARVGPRGSRRPARDRRGARSATSATRCAATCEG